MELLYFSINATVISECILTPKKDAIIVRPAKAPSRVRGRHRIEDLVAAIPRGYNTAGFDWGTSGREVW